MSQENEHVSELFKDLSRIAGFCVLALGCWTEIQQHLPNPKPPFGEGTIYDYMGNWTLSVLMAVALKVAFSAMSDGECEVENNLQTLLIAGGINILWEALSYSPNPEFAPDVFVGGLAIATTLYVLRN